MRHPGAFLASSLHRAGTATSLFERIARTRTAFALSRSRQRCCKGISGNDSENHHPIVVLLAGNAPTRPPLAVAVRLEGDDGIRGPADVERRAPPRVGILPHPDLERAPLLVVSPNTPASRVADPSDEGLEVPFVLMDQPRHPFQRRPAKDAVFPNAGVLSLLGIPADGDHSPTPRTDAFMTPPSSR